MNQGVFLVIEGTDGSGKGTQFKLLQKRLVKEGYDVVTFDFPQYEKPSSYFVKEYLNGKYGSADEVGPYTGSLFYALDRYQAAPAICKALEDGKVVLANRFTGSNMAHQGTKFEHAEERRGYFIWLDNLEFRMLNIPRPSKSIVLRVPASTAQQLVDSKETRSYTDKKRDIHEADLSHLEKSVLVYDELCSLFPKDFISIDCIRNSELQSIEQIQKQLWETILPLLPEPTNQKGKVNTVHNHEVAPNPYIHKEHGEWQITPDGQAYLEDAVTDPTGKVYAFTDKIDPTTVAAGMARLSRRADDMRVTILDEFAGQEEKDEGLLQRVITAYGDDSVQQLVGMHVVVEDCSNLLTKHLEWGRLASYLEQSTRYIFYDEKDTSGKYKFTTPENMNPEMAERYDSTLTEIFDNYSSIVHKLTDYVRNNSAEPEENRDGAWKAATRAQACDAARLVLPVATKSTVGIYGSAQALEYMVMRLRASESLEARDTGDSILNEIRKVNPTFFERADKPERGGATTAYMANTRKKVGEVAMRLLPETYSGDAEAVTLVNFTPRNEVDLVPHMLYEHSSMSLAEIKEAVETWTYEQKMEVFNTYMGERLNRRHKPGRAVEQARYTWDIMCDYGIFRDLQRHRMVDDLEWQNLTPRFGYEVPQLIEDADLTEEFEKCFDLSYQLYSNMQTSGYAYEAQYATLLGHKMRWTITYNAREAFHLHELRTAPQGHPGYRKLVGEMHKKVAEVHPMLAEAMVFVNKGEDPALTRLAAERATQDKLERLAKK
jgi:thymidylate kinase/thymidylate synthase ThyX